jgi:hypothetical protein
MRLELNDNTPSILDSFQSDGSEQEKMSKSRGNSVSVDMVVNGVASIGAGQEFRDLENRVIQNWKRCGIWRGTDGFYRTSPAFGKRPVFLCLSHEIIPSRLVVNRREVMQHGNLLHFWEVFHEAFPDEFYETGNMSYFVARHRIHNDD